MFTNLKTAFMARLTPTGEHITALKGDLRSRLQWFRANRNSVYQQRLRMDFAQVLSAWGITSQGEIQEAIRALQWRILIFALPVILGSLAAAIAQSLLACFTLLLVGVPCLLGIITSYWRMCVLKNRRFLPFWSWLLSAGGGVSVSHSSKE